MRIVKISGGLGNQMFQYALMIGLQETFKEEVYADTSSYKNYNLHNGLELERIFPISLKQAKRNPLLARKLTLSRSLNRYLPFICGDCQFEYPDFRFVDNIYNPRSKKRFYAGYWHNYQYIKPFRAEIMKAFTFKIPLDQKNQEVIDIISKQNSVGIHIRRGDYLKEAQYQGICTLEYYKKAIDLVRGVLKDPVYYLFSNDMEWCKENITPLINGSKAVYVDWNTGEDSYRDMQLMTYCKGMIIANSSFSWWGAFLNQREFNVVVSPARWKNAKYDLKIQMPEWTLI